MSQQWWQKGVIYQVYPRSFQDTNGDGVGDLRGILERLDYLVELGVDAVWVSPFYPSPMADFGYDVANYTDVDPLFGTLADFDALIAGAHERGLRLILDFVPNHTSNQHPGFWSRAARGPTRSATGTCGAIPLEVVACRTTGCRTSAVRAGRSMRRRDRTTTIPSCASSRT
jgi:alpha-glucosidase